MSDIKKCLHMSQSIAKYALFGLYFVSIIVLTYYCYPGALICEEDTQIYLPILLRAQDHSLLRNDLITQHPHTAFTLFDELAVFIGERCGLSLTLSLTVLQIISRSLLLASFILLLRVWGCAEKIAFALAGFMMLGGAIPGVQILIVEYESVPRGIAFSLSLMALALVVRQRFLAGTFLGSLGLLIHATTTLPFWIGWAAVLLSAGEGSSLIRLLPAAALPAGSVLLLTTSAFRSSPGEQFHNFLSFVDRAWENLLKFRVSYVFVSDWSGLDLYLLFWTLLIFGFAWWQCRLGTSPVLSRFIAVTGFWASIMVLTSWILLDHFKVAFFTQVQPARSLIFMVVFVLMASWTIAVKSLQTHPLKLESCLWVFSSLFFGLDRTLLVILWPLLGLEVSKNLILRNLSGVSRNRIRRICRWLEVCVAILGMVSRPFGLELLSWSIAKEVSFAAVFCWGFWALLNQRWISQQLACPSLLIFVVLVFMFLPSVFGKPASTPDRTQIREVADWARRTSAVDAVFSFPDAERDKFPGVFRYYANRAVYVDWKSGGQINFSRSFAMEWWERWDDIVRKSSVQNLAAKGVDFFITREPQSNLGSKLVHENKEFWVYSTH